MRHTAAFRKRTGWNVLLALGLALFLALGACSGDGGGSSDAGRGRVSSMVLDRGAISPEEGTYADNRYTRWINENGPVDVTFVPIPRAEAVNKLNVLLASGDAPDVLAEYDTAWLGEMANQRQLLPLDELIEAHGPEYKRLLERYPMLRKLGTMEDGKLYLIGSVSRKSNSYGIFIRQDWLERLGLSAPETVDALFEVARAFAERDPDGNGKRDTYGLNMSYEAIHQIDVMFGNEMMIVRDDRLVRQFDRIEAATAFKKKLFEAGVVDRDFLTDKNGQQALLDFANGKLGIYMGQRRSVDAVFNALKANAPDAKVAPIRYPTSPFGSYGPDFNPPFYMNAAINARAEDPVAALRFIDFMLQPKSIETIEYGFEGEHYVRAADGCPQPIDAVRNKREVFGGELAIWKASALLPNCRGDSRLLSSTDPIDREYLEMYRQSESIYWDPSRPHPGFTNPRYRPVLPTELQNAFNDGWSEMNSLVARSIVSGDAYPPAQAVKDIRASWIAGGGEAVEAWYDAWYREHKDDWVFMEELYRTKVE